MRHSIPTSYYKSFVNARVISTHLISYSKKMLYFWLISQMFYHLHGMAFTFPRSGENLEASMSWPRMSPPLQITYALVCSQLPLNLGDVSHVLLELYLKYCFSYSLFLLVYALYLKKLQLLVYKWTISNKSWYWKISFTTVFLPHD